MTIPLIRDGEELPFSDYWNRNIGPSSKTPENLLSLGTYLAFGQGENESVLQGTARRENDRIFIEGDVFHGFKTKGQGNRYNFDQGQVFAAEAYQLKKHDLAMPFDMQYRSKQTVDSVVRIQEGSNGNRSFTVERTNWGPME